MAYPRITIVTPSFNQGLFLEACLRSVICQGYPNLEYIVLDGGSSDLSRYLLRKYSQHLHYWRSELDKGHYQAIQEGFDMSSGDIFAWLNSDDMLHPFSLWTVAEFFMANPTVEWVTGLPTAWNSSGELTYINPNPPNWSKEYFINILQSEKKVFLQQESTFFSKRIWQECGSRLDLKYSLAADFELWLRFSSRSNVAKVNSLIGGFREHGQQKTARQYELYLSEVDQIVSAFNSSLGENQMPINYCVAKIAEPLHRIATSLAPKDLVNQFKAVNTWLDNGFQVYSFNCQEEIKKLSPLYPDVVFQEVSQTAQAIVGKPLVFLEDILRFFHGQRTPFTLINSDIHFSVGKGIASRLDYELRSSHPSAIIASRVEVENEMMQLNPINEGNAVCRMNYGRHYFMGFDMFSLNISAIDSVIAYLDRSSLLIPYGLGIPWWDYWLPMVCLENNVKLKYLMPPPIFHFYHEAQYSKRVWRQYGVAFCSEFGLMDCHDQLSECNDIEKIDEYLDSICSQVIRHIGSALKDLDLGPIVRPPGSVLPHDGVMNQCTSIDNNHYAFISRETMLSKKLASLSTEVKNLEAVAQHATKGNLWAEII